jgi:hypothetical protein
MSGEPSRGDCPDSRSQASGILACAASRCQAGTRSGRMKREGLLRHLRRPWPAYCGGRAEHTHFGRILRPAPLKPFPAMGKSLTSWQRESIASFRSPIRPDRVCQEFRRSTRGRLRGQRVARRGPDDAPVVKGVSPSILRAGRGGKLPPRGLGDRVGPFLRAGRDTAKRTLLGPLRTRSAAARETTPTLLRLRG